jgi:hypothetical protein
MLALFLLRQLNTNTPSITYFKNECEEAFATPSGPADVDVVYSGP